MSEVVAGTTTPSIGLKTWQQLAQRTDLMFAFGLVMVMSILIMPMPKVLMDMCLTISLAFSVVILMTSLFIEKPIEFSSFPTILLVSTMIRLSLNVASTRLILTHGHEGAQAAGHVIEAFGQFVMGGNFVIGIIVFAILVIVNFVVITKGSGRIAEVSARFSLDAMPGKQMAIDADLSSGLIDEEGAKKRRREIEAESNFYGAMDGAAKFVRGDAIAGLLITFINVIGGVIIGIVQQGLSFQDATTAYTLLTVGDGLVTQIPALIVSTAAGLLVSKSGTDGITTDKALFGQLSAYPQALGMCSFLMGCMGILPGLPLLPFFIMSSITGFAAWFLNKKQNSIKEAQQKSSELSELKAGGAMPMGGGGPAAGGDSNQDIFATAQQIDMIRLELGYGLLPLVSQSHVIKLPEQIRTLRQRFAQDFGVIMPTIRLQDNASLQHEEYAIYIKETEAGRGFIRLNHFLVMDPEAKPIELPGEATTEPSFGLAAKWIEERFRAEAEVRGYTVVDAGTVLTTYLSELVKDNITDLFTFGDVQRMLDQLSDAYKKLLNDIVPGQITVGGIQRVLQNLIGERVSIRDLSTILEGIAEGCSFTRNTSQITEHVRSRLMRQITFSNIDEHGTLPVVTLSPEWEEIFITSLFGEGDVKQLSMPPSDMQNFINKVRYTYDQLSMRGESPVLVTSALVRPYVRSILERARPSTIIMSQVEVHPKTQIRSLGRI